MLTRQEMLILMVAARRYFARLAQRAAEGDADARLEAKTLIKSVKRTPRDLIRLATRFRDHLKRPAPVDVETFALGRDRVVTSEWEVSDA